ncbi:MAG TPA: DUF2298 domain-containing protein, partial [Ktedonobacterales bacterium]
MRETFTWWLLIEALGLAGLPLTALLFAHLPDRGWAFAKPLSLLVVGWLVWFPLSLVSALPFTRLWILGTLLVFLGVNLRLLCLPDIRQALRTLWRRARGYLITVELLFAGAFALMGWERSFTPGAVDTEKFMDLAFLSGIWRAPHLPPPDPWLSGQPINYYYFGHYLLALVAKIIGTEPAVAFNLGIALIFALAAVAIFGVAANIVAARAGGRLGRGAIWSGLASVALVLLLGNLSGAQDWWQHATQASAGPLATLASPWQWWQHRELWPTYDWWAPSRVIPNTINEFPAFSFVLADLHAHVLALPFTALAAGIALNLLLASGDGVRAFGGGRAGWLALGTAAVALGALYAINGWDLPTYLGLALLALAIQQWLAHERRLDGRTLRDFALAGGALAVLSILLYLPFYRGFVSPSQGIGLVSPAARSPIGDEVAIFGLPVFLLGSLLVVRLTRWWGALAIVPGLAGFLLLTRATSSFTGWTIFWGVALVGLCAALALRRLGVLAERETEGSQPHWRDRGHIFVYCLAGTAAALVVTCELIFLRDIFGGGEAFRMNTVFKLYFQVWLLAGLAAGPALIWLLAGAWRALALDGLRADLRNGLASIRLALAVLPGSSSVSALDVATSASSGDQQPLDDALLSTSAAPSATRLAVGAPESAPVAVGHTNSIHLPERVAVLQWLRAGGIVLWMAALSGLVAAALIYPVLAVSARTQNFTLARSLDGAAYMATDPVNAGDEAAILWL